MKKKVILWVLIGLVVLGLLIQLIPLPGRGSNPPVIAEPNWDSPQTRALVKRACFDCHSNESIWPPYAYVAPVSWLIYNDVMEGRSRMNFSDWNRGYQPSVGELIGELEEGGMPPAKYLLMHPDARLADAEKQLLISGLQNTLK